MVILSIRKIGISILTQSFYRKTPKSRKLKLFFSSQFRLKTCFDKESIEHVFILNDHMNIFIASVRSKASENISIWPNPGVVA